MFNYNEYKITRVRKRDLSTEEVNFANKYPIITKGEETSPYYLLEINNFEPIKVINDLDAPLEKARLEGCKILNEKFNYPLDKPFKSICYTNYDRENNPQPSYFIIERR
ncbi:hypothetical protein ACIQXU_16485 [Peribacillus sp. NPDC097284]|uniref:hypothetical protein n=1 Tax=Peribacillus sp. NPDC097284 TaxID=3364401 RepID=UPI0038263220